MAECRHHAGYDCGDLPLPHDAVPENRLPKPKRRNSREFLLAVTLSAILDEPGDSTTNPAPIRIEQAKTLLTHWSSAQSALTGAAWEILNIKQGFCVRCPKDDPVCAICGRDVPEDYRNFV